MRKTLRIMSLLLLLPALLHLAAQAQTAAWQGALPSADVQVLASSTDAAGMVYVTGNFSGTVAFGATTLTATSPYQNFVAKWNPATHGYVWGFALGAHVLAPTAPVVDNGIVYLAGQYQGTSIVICGVTVTGSPWPSTAPVPRQSFVLALADGGTSASFRWVLGVSSSIQASVVTLAAQGGSLYVGGGFLNTVQLGGTTLTGISTSTSNYYTGMLIKLSGAATATPTVAWAQALSGYAGVYVYKLAAAGSTLYLMGELWQGSLQLGSTTLNTTVGGYDDAVLVARLTDNGTSATYNWATMAVRAPDLLSLAMDVRGTDLFLAGSWRGAALTVGSTTQPNPYPNAGATAGRLSDIFVTKLTDAGAAPAFGWTKLAGGEGVNSVVGLVVRGSAVYVAGEYDSDHLSWGTNTLINYSPISSYDSPGPLNTDWFVGRVTDNGATATMPWAVQAGGGYTDRPYTFAVSNSELYVGGFVVTTGAAPVTIGPVAIGPMGGSNYVYGLAWLTETNALAASPAATLPGLALYPNPAHGPATVRVPAGGPATLTLLDALGRVVRTGAAPAGQDYPLDVSGLAPGVYALRVQAGEGQAVRQVVVE